MRRFELTSVGMTGGEAIDEVEAGGGWVCAWPEALVEDSSSLLSDSIPSVTLSDSGDTGAGAWRRRACRRLLLIIRSGSCTGNVNLSVDILMIDYIKNRNPAPVVGW